MRELTSASLAHLSRILLNGFLYRPLLFLWGRVGGLGIVTEACHVPLSQLCICNHQYHCKSGFLALYSKQEHRSWVNKFFGDSAEHEHGSLTTVQPLTQIRPSGTSQTTDTNVAPGGSAGHAHQYDPWGRHNLWTSIWFQAAMWAMNIETDSGCSTTSAPEMALEQQHVSGYHRGLRWQCRPFTAALSSLLSRLRLCGSLHRLPHSTSLSLPSHDHMLTRAARRWAGRSWVSFIHCHRLFFAY